MTDELPPTRRHSLMGRDFDGNQVVMSFSISHKLYRCPGCGNSVEVGAEHTLVRYTEPDGQNFHQHWHRDCARTLEREMTHIQTRPASEVQGNRGPRPRGRRRR